jgi:hypothetical protein
MPVFKNILVPVDLTDTHQPVLEIAARLAQENDGEVTLLHVVEVISEVWATEDRAFYTRLEQTARDHLAWTHRSEPSGHGQRRRARGPYRALPRAHGATGTRAKLMSLTHLRALTGGPPRRADACRVKPRQHS